MGPIAKSSSREKEGGDATTPLSKYKKEKSLKKSVPVSKFINAALPRSAFQFIIIIESGSAKHHLKKYTENLIALCDVEKAAKVLFFFLHF